MVPKKTIQIGEFLAIIEFESPILEPKKKKQNPFKHFLSPDKSKLPRISPET
jgi:hypothetical protein